jgi:IclR family KDG regulon transcriptional repressor
VLKDAMPSFSPKGNKRKSKPARQRTALSSVANATRLLKAFSDDQCELGVSDLAKELRLAKSTVFRLASTLASERMLEQDPESGKYRLGLVLFELGSLVRRKMDVSSEARPILRALMEKTGETVHLAVLDDHSAIYTNRVESRQAIRTAYGLGTRAPLHCTALGKALLAFQTPAFIDEVIAEGLPRRTQNTITSPHALRQELSAVRARGYALEDEETELALRSIASAVYDDTARVVASIGISGPAHRLTRKVLQAYANDLMSATDAVSQRLGYRPAQLRKRA